MKSKPSRRKARLPSYDNNNKSPHTSYLFTYEANVLYAKHEKKPILWRNLMREIFLFLPEKEDIREEIVCPLLSSPTSTWEEIQKAYKL